MVCSYKLSVLLVTAVGQRFCNTRPVRKLVIRTEDYPSPGTRQGHVATMKRTTKKSIDDEQSQTVEDHFQRIMTDNTFIDSNYTKVTPDDLPSWFDEDLFKRGQLYYDRNVMSTHIAYLTGLMAVFLVPAIAKILIFTKQSSSPCPSYKRYLQTLLHVVQLHESDIKDSKSKFYKSLNTIRWKHSMASKLSEKNNDNGISQRDMVLTQFGFVGYVLVRSDELGFTNEGADRQAFNHFWRVLGHLLGIPDRLNLCRRNEYETTLLCEQIMNKVMSETLKNPDTEFYFLTGMALQGLRAIDPTFDTDVFFKLFYELHSNQYEKQLSWYSDFMYLYRKSIIASFSIPIVGRFLRIYWNKYVRVINWISENYPFIAWMKYGKKQSKINLYPHPAI